MDSAAEGRKSFNAVICGEVSYQLPPILPPGNFFPPQSSLRPGQASDVVETQRPAVVAAAIGPSSHHPKSSGPDCQGTCVMSESLATVPCGECAGALYRRSTVSGSRRGAFTSCRCGCWTAGRTTTGGDGFCHCRQPHALLLCLCCDPETRTSSS